MTLKVWFERYGMTDFPGYVRFSYDQHEVDPLIMSEQAALDAGPLFGLLEITDLPESTLRTIRGRKVDTPAYIKLGKRVVDALFPPLSNLITILRTNYGQYWLPPLRQWDSREETLGRYCNSLQMQWSLDDGRTWATFLPTRAIRYTTRSIAHWQFTDYLTQADWKELEQVAQAEYIPPLSSIILARAHQFYDVGDLRSAFLEAVTALDITMSQYLRQKLPKDTKLAPTYNWITGNEAPQKHQFAIACLMLGTIQITAFETALAAMEIRNKIAHEGFNPPSTEEMEECIATLIEVIAKFQEGPAFRFPSSTPADVRMTSPDWEEYEPEQSQLYNAGSSGEAFPEDMVDVLRPMAEAELHQALPIPRQKRPIKPK